MSANAPLFVTARLCSPLAGDAPMLDGLLEALMSLHVSSIEASKGKIWDKHKITRAGPAPEQGSVPMPIKRFWLGEWYVPLASSPVLSPVHRETVEHVNKRIATEHAGLLRDDCRNVVATTSGWTKSYRLPLRVRLVESVRWCCVGDKSDLRRRLKKCQSIGKKVSDGYGRVSEWIVEDAPADYSWFAPGPDDKPVLMRPLPLGEWLPAGLQGAARDYCGLTPPYWHPSRNGECVRPAA